MGEEVNASCVKCEDTDDIYDMQAPTPKKVVLTERGINYRPTREGHVEQAYIVDDFSMQTNPTIF